MVEEVERPLDPSASTLTSSMGPPRPLPTSKQPFSPPNSAEQVVRSSPPHATPNAVMTKNDERYHKRNVIYDGIKGLISRHTQSRFFGDANFAPAHSPSRAEVMVYGSYLIDLHPITSQRAPHPHRSCLQRTRTHDHDEEGTIKTLIGLVNYRIVSAFRFDCHPLLIPSVIQFLRRWPPLHLPKNLSSSSAAAGSSVDGSSNSSSNGVKRRSPCSTSFSDISTSEFDEMCGSGKLGEDMHVILLGLTRMHI